MNTSTVRTDLTSLEKPYYIAKCGDKKVGVCGLNLDPYLNNQKIGRVRHLYVSRAFQKQGLGQSLVSKIIDEADRYYEVIVLRTSNPIADRLYCALGFSKDSPYDSATHFLQFSNTQFKTLNV